MNKTVIGIGLLSVLMLVVGVLFLSSQDTPGSNTSVLTYSAGEKDKPVAEAEDRLYDMGKVKVKEEKSKDFILKNTGSKTLQLTNISSSCGCTVAKVIYNGRESKEFGMHSQSSEIIEILPKTEAVIRMIYRPYVMPVYGQVEREVYISTNDPQNRKITFSVRAYVE